MLQCNLVLSGGGARGFAHLGVVKALREKGISFSAISATSSGAMIGVLLCDGYSVEEIIKICHEALPLTKFNFHFTQGLLSIESLNKILDKYLRSKTFERLKYPLFVSATDLNTGKQVIFSSGDVIPAIVASSSIPVVFPPMYINGIPYADGGMSGNLPVEPFDGAPAKLIGVHVNPVSLYDASQSMLRQFERVVHLSIRENILRQIQKLDLFIEPDGLKPYGLFDTKKIDEIVQVGYNFASRINVNSLR